MTTIRDLANRWLVDLPVYEPGLPIEEVARRVGIADASTIAKLASNENALGPSPRAVTAMHEAALSMHRYPDGGSYYLRAGIAAAVGVSPSCVLPVNGSNEAIELLARLFLNAGTSLVMADGAFLVYRLVAAAQQAACLAVPMRDLTHDLDAMAAAIRPDTRLVFIANPNNPTGTMVDGAAIERFMARVPDHVVVCFDEAYVELLPPERQPDVLRYVREGRPVVVLRTFSKAYGLAGLRIGYLVGTPDAVALLDRIRQPFNVNRMAQAAALAALDDDEHLRRTRAMIRQGLSYLCGELDRLGVGYVPSCVNFMLVKVGRGREVFEALQRLGVIARPMDVYGLGDYIRVTVGTAAENGRFIGALEAVLAGRSGPPAPRLARRIVAIDGPAASGKSTVSRALAERMGAVHVDSGAYYRCVTWQARRRGVSCTDETAVLAMIAASRWEPVRYGRSVELVVDGERPQEALRTDDVNRHVSTVAAMPGVRQQVVAWLRQTAECGDLVMEGRDIGTVVFPDTPHKFFLEAAAEERARRRHAEMTGAQPDLSVTEIDASLRVRDRLDSTRKADPLRVAPGAERVDSTRMTADEVVRCIHERIAGAD